MSRFGLVTLCILLAFPARAADFPPSNPPVSEPLLQRVNLFSSDPQNPVDPRHTQSQTGVEKVFAPIGLIVTNHLLPDDDSLSAASHYHAGTAFLVSPCYVLTAYHVIFGSRRSRPDPDQDYSATFRVAGVKSRAMPVEYGELYRFTGRDWVLLRLDSDADHPCAGENPEIGWTRLAPLKTADATQMTVSIASYPGDKPATELWRQDSCRLYEKSGNIDNDGMWTTDCATLPRASGSPIFFLRDSVLNVVALMHGHEGNETTEVLPHWDPSRANLALDVGKIVSSDPHFMEMIEQDIARFGKPNPAQVSEPGNPATAPNSPPPL